MRIKRILLVFISSVLCLTCLSACVASDSDNSGDPNLSAELEYEIKKAYTQSYWGFSDESRFDINEVSMEYYGTYSGYEAILNTGIGSAVITSIEVGGYLFNFSTSNIILMYKNGEFIEFNTAFHEGKITQEDIDRLFKIYGKQ